MRIIPAASFPCNYKLWDASHSIAEPHMTKHRALSGLILILCQSLTAVAHENLIPCH